MRFWSEPTFEEIPAGLSEKDLRTAWLEWIYRDHFFTEIDEWLESFAVPPSPGPWLSFAKRLQFHPSTYEKFEKRESDGKISLLTLKHCANALNCDLIYAFRPREGKSFSRRNWEVLLHEVQNHPALPNMVPHRRGYLLARLIREKREDASFCRRQNWIPGRRQVRRQQGEFPS